MIELNSIGRIKEGELEKLEIVVNSDTNPILFLGIDPGKRNGICGYDAKYCVQFMLNINEADVAKFLRCFTKLQKIIMEGYKLYPNKAKQQIYSDMLTPRVIGRVEDYCDMRNIDLIIQPASIKPTGYMWIGKKPPPKGNINRDPMDAHVHFMYWAVKNRLINAADLLR